MKNVVELMEVLCEASKLGVEYRVTESEYYYTLSFNFSEPDFNHRTHILVSKDGLGNLDLSLVKEFLHSCNRAPH